MIQKQKIPYLLPIAFSVLIAMPACEFKCSTGGGYDHSIVIKTLNEKLNLADVKCEEPKENPKKDSFFRCTGSNKLGDQKTYVVIFLDDKYRFDALYYNEQQMIEGIKRQMELADLKCPPATDPRKGDSLSCSGTDGDGREREVKIAFTSDKYNYEANYAD